MRFPREKTWQAKPFMGTRANGGFTATEIKTPGLEFRNHAIHINSNGEAKLAGDGERIDGFFVQFDGGDLVEYRDTTKGQWARNGLTNTSIGIGQRVVGAVKTGVPEDKPTHGYVKGIGQLLPNADLPTTVAYANALFNACNNIVRGPQGAVHAADAYPPADVVVELGVASSD